MYEKVLETLKKTLEKVRSFDAEDTSELQKSLRDLKISLDDGLIKYNESGQWSINKASDVKPSVYRLSEKWEGKIPKDHPDHKAMVGHINDMNQSGSQAEARRIYDKHISGGGAYTKDVTEKADRSKWIKPKDKDTTEDKIAQAKWDHDTKVDDVAGKNTKLEETRFNRSKG